MTRAEAAAWKYAKAGSVSLDGDAVLKCAARGEGCEVFAVAGTQPLEATPIPDMSASCVPCQRHRPTKRFAWLHDVAVEDVVAHANAADGAFEVDELRRYLPRKHLEWRAGR